MPFPSDKPISLPEYYGHHTPRPEIAEAQKVINRLQRHLLDSAQMAAAPQVYIDHGKIGVDLSMAGQLAAGQMGGGGHAADALGYVSDGLSNQGLSNNPPVPRGTPQISNVHEHLTEEEERIAIGTYMMNFVSYGLHPEVKSYAAQNKSEWMMTLNGEGFSMTITAHSLVDALRQADMAAGGWFAQREIERNIFEAKIQADRAESATSATSVIAKLQSLANEMMTNNMPAQHIVMHPSTYDKMCSEMKIAKSHGNDGFRGEFEGIPVMIDARLSRSSQPQLVRTVTASPQRGVSAVPSPSPAWKNPE